MPAPLYTTPSGQLFHAGKILVATVGLPARGKTHLSHAIQRYLRWLGVRCRVFSLGDVRREIIGTPSELPQDYFGHGPKDPLTEQLRREVMEQMETNVLSFFGEGGQVAIYDASNSSQAQRYSIRKLFEANSIQIMFIESVCDDERMIEDNVRGIWQSSPDYHDWTLEDTLKDFSKRVKQHELQYEPIVDPTFPHVQVQNLGQRIVVNNVYGYLQNRIVFFLMNIHTRNRIIYFARTGEALIEHLYKADAELSPLGHKYAEKLRDYVTNLRQPRSEKNATPQQEHNVSWLTSSGRPFTEFGDGNRRPLQVWVSTRKRAVETAAPLRSADCRVVEMTRLGELNPGVVDGMSEEEIEQRFPGELAKRDREPYSFRFPRGESFHDLSIRLEPVIFELERTREDVLIIAQPSVLRCLIAYLQGNKPSEIPYIQVREGDLVAIWPQAYGVSSRVYNFWDPERMREERDLEIARLATVQST
ncbi:hypothetical protein MCUN1_001341 [Malassezia cuniculi]|uniref:6-phosphofructo-2-kinase domain-containing protein n=1 Tax=Malassezia cuniculi TaxID=948313 RepID=A0AAF0J5X5_9BASI|nr:hypothetical protein MCUN1_001341 [Malassezia cuniculi]